MITALESYVRRWRRTIQKIWADPELQEPLLRVCYFFGGFCMSAASLGSYLQPFCLGLLCAGMPGWLPAFFGIGSALGYWVFWGIKGLQGVLWVAAALPVGVLVARNRNLAKVELLQPALASLIVAASGVLFQSWRGESAPIVIYLLRVGLAFGAVWTVQRYRIRRDTVAGWVMAAVGVLALAQIAPLPILNFGILLAAMFVANLPFPAVAMAGLALDLAQVTSVPMTAVLCLGALLRLLPKLPVGAVAALPAGVYLLMMTLCGQMDLTPLPGLAVGGFISVVLPARRPRTYRRGEMGFAQVRLEMAAGVMAQSEQLLQTAEGAIIDEAALIGKAVSRACGSCPNRKNCKEPERIACISGELLHKSHIQLDDLPGDCKKRSRLLQELRRSQDQLRILHADRQRRREYQEAVAQQYHFLSEYLQELADQLPERGNARSQRFHPEVAVCSSGKESVNGDRCLWFAGTDCRYYLLLCDGMGTGAGAAEAAKTAGNMLRRLLMAGYPARYALRCINSLCTLRGQAGIVTMDLAEIRLDTGKVNVYKWGAAPSYLLLPTGTEQIGIGGMPPGLSVNEARETVDSFTMRHGEMLVLLSDGVEAEAMLRYGKELLEESPGGAAARLLEWGKGMDDATAAVIRLDPM